jgi:choline dehydrogenase-like flavoprotein
MQTFVSAVPTIIERNEDLHSSYTYVIVGGGVSGLVVANRLTEDTQTTVLVIEAGDLYIFYPSENFHFKTITNQIITVTTAKTISTSPSILESMLGGFLDRSTTGIFPACRRKCWLMATSRYISGK